MYLIEFERCKEGLAVRILDPTAAFANEATVLAEAIFAGDAGVSLTGDQDIAVLRLPFTARKGTPNGPSSD